MKNSRLSAPLVATAFLLTLLLSPTDAVHSQSISQSDSSQSDSSMQATEVDSGRVKFSYDALGKVSQIEVNQSNPPRAARSASRPGSVRIKDATSNPVGIANNFLRSFGRVWVDDPDAELVVQRLESHMGQRVRFGQVFNGIRVVGSQIIVELETSGVVKRAAGSAITLKEVPDLIPSLSDSDAQEAALKLWSQEMPQPGVVHQNDLVLVTPAFLEGKDPSQFETFLAYEIAIDSHPTGGFIYYIDAHSGELRHQISTAHDAGPLNRLIYDCSPRLIGYPLCYWNLVVNGYRYGRQESDLNSFGINPHYQAFDVDVMYDEFSPLHNWVFNRFNRNGGNFQNGTVDPTIANPRWSFASVYLDAEWGANCRSASFSRGRLNFCRHALIPHVTGHEYAHSFTYFAHPPNGQTYSGLSASLDESQAFIFGEMFERYRSGTADWVAGVPGSSYILNMGNPTSSQDTPPNGPFHPDRFYSNNFLCSGNSATVRYNNAAVPSYGAYLAARGGNFNGCSITGIGDLAVEQILYRAVTTCYPTTPTFLNAYNCQVNACRDLYGANSYTCRQFEKALQSVELNQPGRCSGVARVNPACTLAPAAQFQVTQVSQPLPVDNPPLPFTLPPSSEGTNIWVPLTPLSGEASRITVRVTNSGPGILELGAAQVPSGVTLVSYPQVIGSQQEAEIVLQVRSRTLGMIGKVIIPTNDPQMGTLVLRIGVGQTSFMRIAYQGSTVQSGSLVDLGTVALGSQSSFTFSIANTAPRDGPTIRTGTVILPSFLSFVATGGTGNTPPGPRLENLLVGPGKLMNIPLRIDTASAGERLGVIKFKAEIGASTVTFTMNVRVRVQ